MTSLHLLAGRIIVVANYFPTIANVLNNRRSLETVFSVVVLSPVGRQMACRQTGDTWQRKTLFLTIFYLRFSIVLTFSIAACPVCLHLIQDGIFQITMQHKWVNKTWAGNAVCGCMTYYSILYLKTLRKFTWLCSSIVGVFSLRRLG